MAESSQRPENRREANRKMSPNWEQIHRRLQAARAAAEGGGQPTPEEAQRILRDRAKELAREPTPEEEAGEILEVVEFLVANERYGIESRHVREVHPVRDPTTVPCAPPFVLGVINVRGRIVSILDIKKFFELPEIGLTDLNKVVIVSREGMELGILADAIAGLRMVPVRELQPSLPTLTEVRAEYLKGVSGDRLVVLDAEKILSDPKLVAHQEAES
jgi:purine-binding chemotaxis protein CheW